MRPQIPAMSKVCSIPGVIYVITSAAQCLLALPSYQQELEWSRPTRPSSLEDVSTLFKDITNQNTMSPSITLRCTKTFWRNGEAGSKGEAEVTTLYYCHVQPDFDYFKVAWEALQVNSSLALQLAPMAIRC